MTFGERLTTVRKNKEMSQSQIGKLIGINGDAIGRYERNEVRPTIEMAAKIANALEVSLDYLTGSIDLEFDKPTLKRMELITKLPEESKKQVYTLLDALLRDFQAKSVYAANT